MEIVQWCKEHFLRCLCSFLRSRGGLVQTSTVPVVSRPAQPPSNPPKANPATEWTRMAILKRKLRLGCGAWSDGCALIQHWVTCCGTDFSTTKHWGLASLRAPDTSLNCLMGDMGFGGISLKINRVVDSLEEVRAVTSIFFKLFFFCQTSLFMPKLRAVLSFHILVSIFFCWRSLNVGPGCPRKLCSKAGSRRKERCQCLRSKNHSATGSCGNISLSLFFQADKELVCTSNSLICRVKKWNLKVELLQAASLLLSSLGVYLSVK